MSYLDKAGLEKLWLGLKDKLASKQDKLSSTNKLPYSYISGTPTIPTPTVISGDEGKTYIIKVSSTPPESGTADNVITIVKG